MDRENGNFHAYSAALFSDSLDEHRSALISLTEIARGSGRLHSMYTMPDKIVSRAVVFLKDADHPDRQILAAQFLCTAVKNSRVGFRNLLDMDIVPSLVQIIDILPKDTHESVVQNIEKIVYDYSRQLVETGGPEAVLNTLQRPLEPWMLRYIMKMLANMCRAAQDMQPRTFIKLCAKMRELLAHETDGDVLMLLCDAFSNICRAHQKITTDPMGKRSQYRHMMFYNVGIRGTVCDDVCVRFVELLAHEDGGVRESARRAVRAVIDDDFTYISVFVGAGLMDVLTEQIVTANATTMARATEIVAAMSVRTPDEHFDDIFTAFVVDRLIYQIKHYDDDSTIHAIQILDNIAKRNSVENARFLANRGCIEVLCAAIQHDNSMRTLHAINALHEILKIGDREKRARGADAPNPYAQRVEACDGVGKMRALIWAGDPFIHTAAQSVLYKFFAPRNQ